MDSIQIEIKDELEDEDKTFVVPEQTVSKSKLKRNHKIGHFRVDTVTGQTSYKNTPAAVLSRCVQKGITFSVGRLTTHPDRDVLLQDFEVVETILFPREGSKLTPAHPFDDFTFKTYAPTAFRYFRDLFGILPSSFMLSINQPLRELANPGASGSMFFVTHDDEYIIKTLQRKEADFLQKLLPGYYMNLVQNPRTLLPKFYGLYCVRSRRRNIRVIVMNNVIPSQLEMHMTFDIKGSTFKRRASPRELSKTRPVLKDLDFLDQVPGGLILEREIRTAFLKTIKRDCLVLESFKIMDYSLLIAIHNVDKAGKERRAERRASNESAEAIMQASRRSSNDLEETPTKLSRISPGSEKRGTLAGSPGRNDLEETLTRLTILAQDSKESLSSTMISPRITLSSKKESGETTSNPESLFNELVVTDVKYKRRIDFLSATIMKNKYTTNLDLWSGGIPARNREGEKILIFCGIIDILQCYRFRKKIEYAIKSMFVDGSTVSVHNPSFYGTRFMMFVTTNVFTRDVSDGKRKPRVPFQQFIPAALSTLNSRSKQRLLSSPRVFTPVRFSNRFLHPFDNRNRTKVSAPSDFASSKAKYPRITIEEVGGTLTYDSELHDSASQLQGPASEATAENAGLTLSDIISQDELIWKSPNAVFDATV